MTYTDQELQNMVRGCRKEIKAVCEKQNLKLTRIKGYNILLDGTHATLQVVYYVSPVPYPQACDTYRQFFHVAI